MSDSNIIIKFCNSKESERPLWFEYEKCRAWTKKLAKGLQLFFLEGKYDLDIDFEVMFGTPIGMARSTYGYVDNEISDEKYIIAIAPGVLSPEAFAATILHELIHAYGGILGHAIDFRRESRKLGLIYHPGRPDELTQTAREKIEHLLAATGPSPYGLTTRFDMDRFKLIDSKWTQSSTIYCPTCYWNDKIFFSNNRNPRKCKKCNNTNLYEINNHPSMVLSDSLKNPPISSPWCGDISPHRRPVSMKIATRRRLKTGLCMLSRKDGRASRYYPLLAFPLHQLENYEKNLNSILGTTHGWSITFEIKDSWIYQSENNKYALIQTCINDTISKAVETLHWQDIYFDDFLNKLFDDKKIARGAIILSETRSPDAFVESTRFVTE